MSRTCAAIVASAIGIAALVAPLRSDACEQGELKRFREMLATAKHVFVFRLLGAELREDARGEWIEGRVRVVESLRGDASNLTRATWSNSWCGGMSLDVGHYYLAADSIDGVTLGLRAAEHSIADISLEYDEGRGRRGLLANVAAYLRGDAPLESVDGDRYGPLKLEPAPPPPPR